MCIGAARVAGLGNLARRAGIDPDKDLRDGADLDGIVRMAGEPHIRGFTTNPTLMWKAGLTDYATRPDDTRLAMSRAGASELTFDFEFRGCTGDDYR